MQDRVNAWLPYSSRDAAAKMRLFCLPYAGGAATVYRNWQAGLPSNIQVCPVELPGRGTRFTEVPATQLPSLAREVCCGILPFLDRPFSVLGHSMGAKLAFEVCRQLPLFAAIQPSFLFVLGSTDPRTPEKDPVHHLSDDQIIERLRSLNSSQPAAFAYPELLRILVPILRADLAASETYVYREDGFRLNCPVMAIVGSEDTEATAQTAEAWKDHTVSFFKLKVLPGDHFFLHTARMSVLQTIAEELRALQISSAKSFPA